MLDADGLLRQATLTSQEYFEEARRYLHETRDGEFPDSFENGMRMAELAAKDFDTMMTRKSMIELISTLCEIGDTLQVIGTALSQKEPQREMAETDELKINIEKLKKD